MIEWRILEDESRLRALEAEACVGFGDLGRPAAYPCFCFLHADFASNQRAEFLRISDLERMRDELLGDD